MDNSPRRQIYRYVVLGMVLVCIGLSIYRYLLKEDFLVYARVSCDSAAENCFAEPCESEDEETSCEPIPYKVITKKASRIPACNAWAGECEELSCEEDEPYCDIVYCTDENIATYEPNAVCLSHE